MYLIWTHFKYDRVNVRCGAVAIMLFKTPVLNIVFLIWLMLKTRFSTSDKKERDA